MNLKRFSQIKHIRCLATLAGLAVGLVVTSNAVEPGRQFADASWVVTIDGQSAGRTFEGVGALSAEASRLIIAALGMKPRAISLGSSDCAGHSTKKAFHG